MDAVRFNTSKVIEVDDSLNHHGGVGVDFWVVKNEGCTELFTLNFDQAVQLTKWLIDYLAVNTK